MVLVWWMTLIACTVEGTDRSGIQIGQESGGCTQVREPLAERDVVPLGFVVGEVLPDAFAPAVLRYPDSTSTGLQLAATWLRSDWVELEPTVPQAECPDDARLETAFELTLQTDDGAFDEVVTFIGGSEEVYGRIRTTSQATVDVRDLGGSFSVDGLERLLIDLQLTHEGDHSGELRAVRAQPGGVEPIGEWTTSETESIE